jgi:hypothetical protein
MAKNETKLPGHVQDLVDERDQLVESIEKLDKVIESGSFEDLRVDERGDLTTQRRLMGDLRTILDRRVERAGVPEQTATDMRHG